MSGILPGSFGGCNTCCSGAAESIDTLIIEEVDRLVGDLFLVGHGSPEGVVTGTVRGQLYTDEDTGSKYTFLGVVGQNIGWV